MNITENGSYSIVPNGIDEMDIEVSVPTSKVQNIKYVNFYANNDYAVNPDEGYDSMKNVVVTIYSGPVLFGINETVMTAESVITIGNNVETTSFPIGKLVFYTLRDDIDNLYFIYTKTAINVNGVYKYFSVDADLTNGSFARILTQRKVNSPPGVYMNIPLDVFDNPNFPLVINTEYACLGLSYLSYDL